MEKTLATIEILGWVLLGVFIGYCLGCFLWGWVQGWREGRRIDKQANACAWRVEPLSARAEITPMRLIVEPGNHCLEDGWKRFTLELEIINPQADHKDTTEPRQER